MNQYFIVLSALGSLLALIFAVFMARRALSFSEGLAGVQSTEGDQLWGYIDKTGTWVIEAGFEGVADFSEGLAAVHGGKLVVAK